MKMFLHFILLHCLFVLIVTSHNCSVKFKFAKVCQFYKDPDHCFPKLKPSCKIIKVTKNEVRCPLWSCPEAPTASTESVSSLHGQFSLPAKTTATTAQPTSTSLTKVSKSDESRVSTLQGQLSLPARTTATTAQPISRSHTTEQLILSESDESRASIFQGQISLHAETTTTTTQPTLTSVTTERSLKPGAHLINYLTSF